MPRVLIIAYGNPLRCDDGLAWRAAEELLQLNLPGDIEIIICHQLTPELAPLASQAANVLFIDAAHCGVPGELVSLTLKLQQPLQPSSVFTHEFSPATILSVAQEFYGSHPEALILSLVGEVFDHGETLSPKVKENLPRLVEHASEWINKAAS